MPKESLASQKPTPVKFGAKPGLTGKATVGKSMTGKRGSSKC